MLAVSIWRRDGGIKRAPPILLSYDLVTWVVGITSVTIVYFSLFFFLTFPYVWFESALLVGKKGVPSNRKLYSTITHTVFTLDGQRLNYEVQGQTCYLLNDYYKIISSMNFILFWQSFALYLANSIKIKGRKIDQHPPFFFFNFFFRSFSFYQ